MSPRLRRSKPPALAPPSAPPAPCAASAVVGLENSLSAIAHLWHHGREYDIIFAVARARTQHARERAPMSISTLDAADAGGAADVDGGLVLWALRGSMLTELEAAKREPVLVMSQPGAWHHTRSRERARATPARARAQRCSRRRRCP